MDWMLQNVALKFLSFGALADFEQDFLARRLECGVVIRQQVARGYHRAGAAELSHRDKVVGLRNRIHHADCVELPVIRGEAVDDYPRVGGLRPARGARQSERNENACIKPASRDRATCHMLTYK